MTQDQSEIAFPKFLLTNDDGYPAPGLAALRRAIGYLEGSSLVVAPAQAVSGCGHAVTTHAKIHSKAEPEGGYSVEGTPADCVRLALYRFSPQARWVISGINAGGNLGVDLFHSGTVAAVREAVFHGRKGVAISHYIARNHPINWEQAASWASVVIGELIQKDLPENTFWNVNLPCLEANAAMPEVVYCPWDRSPLPLDYRFDANSAEYSGVYHQRPRVEGADVSVCFGGRIAVSLVHL